MVYRGLPLFMMVHHGFQSLNMFCVISVHYAFAWFSLVLIFMGLSLFVMVPHGLSSFTIVYNEEVKWTPLSGGAQGGKWK